MKQLILASFLLVSIMACNSQSSSEQAVDSSVEQVAAPIFKDIDVAEFKAKMADDNVVILDVRTPGEIANGKIDGAVEVDFKGDNFAAEIEQLDKDKTYLVYCAAGGRSGRACKLMKGKGFREFYNLEGGYSAWSEQ